ncbi:hypothetical protein RchiOBHm_Chr5g0027811 [Rosa chinensis]|uniref:Uncharacterized protein n=1 Tax=Rosa chinensis TaxID=74649 RepID=A0A2P6Q979_ROSCH|nr:hypothetical protein RchiOBHm_Chr5g0027811 [Rosa chinensis]
MSQFHYLVLYPSPIPLQLLRFTSTSLTLIHLHLSCSIPSFSLFSTVPSHSFSTKVYTPNSTPGNSCRTGTPLMCVDVTGPVALCARWSPPPRLPFPCPLVPLSFFCRLLGYGE